MTAQLAQFLDVLLLNDNEQAWSAIMRSLYPDLFTLEN